MIDPETHGTQFTLSSGFVIVVKPLPPYYNDFIEDALPFVALPRRILHLKSGDEIEVEYIEPKEFPEETDEQELYLRYKTAIKANEEIEKQRGRTKINFLLNNCIDVVSGPVEEGSVFWKAKLQQSLPNYKLPDDPGLLHVAYIKSQVITTQKELDAVLTACFYPEVDIQGIINALAHFQHKISEPSIVGLDKAKAGAG